MTELATTVALCISTAHLTEETSESIREYGLLVARYAYGAFVYVGEPDGDIDEDIPADLAAVMRFCANKGFTWVRFDSAGDITNELPTYTWE